jgi:lycopene beta-cyclase
MPDGDEIVDVLVVGGGLAGSLAALRLRTARPELRIRLLEQAPGPDDSHTWCCFDTDLAPAQAAWVEPMMANRWAGYDVNFPEFSRRLNAGYGRLTSATLARLREQALPGATCYNAHAIEIGEREVRLADGRRLQAPLVLDGRGAMASPKLTTAFQKFVGVEVRLADDHGLKRPIVMDASVPQVDGYRFVYVLPLDERRLLIEDTRYSDGATLPVADLIQEVRRYARARGWRILEETRQEEGVLPIVLGGDFSAYWRDLGAGAAPIGMRALLFHPVTGYSLPHAARLADKIAEEQQLTTARVRSLVETEAWECWRRGGYLRLLNRMLFRAARPDRRFAVLQRFYRLPEPLIERFYAHRLTWADQARLLSGRPPVPVAAALRAIRLPNREVALG